MIGISCKYFVGIAEKIFSAAVVQLYKRKICHRSFMQVSVTEYLSKIVSVIMQLFMFCYVKCYDL